MRHPLRRGFLLLFLGAGLASLVASVAERALDVPVGPGARAVLAALGVATVVAALALAAARRGRARRGEAAAATTGRSAP